MNVERTDWLLLALHHAGEQGLSPVQLQKSLFLLSREVPDDVGVGAYQFIPHNYGPFSRDIYADADALSRRGLVDIQMGGPYSHYAITETGKQRLREVEHDFPNRAYEYLSDVVRWTQKQSFSALVRAIYDKYPEYRVNSVFRY